MTTSQHPESPKSGSGLHDLKIPNPLGPLLTTPPLQLPAPTVLTGENVSLTPTDQTHALDLYLHLCTSAPDELWDYMLTGPWRSVEDFSQFIAACAENPARRSFSIQFMGSDAGVSESVPRGSFVGLCALLSPSLANRSVEVGGVIFAPTLQGTRSATEALYLLIKYSFECGFERVEWKTNSLNERSLKAARRLGFEYEGTFRRHMVAKGRRRDTVYFSIIVEEWPLVKEAFETWLRRENFDENGKQKERLEEVRARLERLPKNEETELAADKEK
jgi:RimJ/RimL family protein N-acetyltransferase